MATQLKTVETSDVNVVIPAPTFQTAAITIKSTAPYVQNKFSHKALTQMQETQKAGSKSNSKKTKTPKNFEENYEAAMHISTEGWCGQPAPAYRNALISACKIVGFKMTHAKLSIFIEADGFDKDDRTPLVRITKGEPHMSILPVRNATGVIDLRSRPMWDEWEVTLRIRWDSDQFSAEDIINLLSRAGTQVGIGDGRPDSRKSAGMGWGLFEVST